LLPSGGGGGNVSVEAPWRMSRKGHSTFGCALVTGCGSLCVAPEKKLAILSFRDGVLGAAGAGGGTAAVDAGAGGTAAVDAAAGGGAAPVDAGAGGGAAPTDAGAGGTAAVEAVVAGAPPPLHPASRSNASAAPAGDPWRQPNSGNARFVPRIIANLRAPIAIANS